MKEEFSADAQIREAIFSADIKRITLENRFGLAPALLDGLDIKRSLAFAWNDTHVETKLVPVFVNSNDFFSAAFMVSQEPNLDGWAESGRKSPRHPLGHGTERDVENLRQLQTTHTLGLGILNSETIKFIFGQQTAKYCHVLGIQNLPINGSAMSDLLHEPGSQTIGEYIGRLEAAGKVEYSEESLYKECQQLVNVMQLDLVRGAMLDLVLLAQTIHWRADIANELLGQYREIVLTDDLAVKIAMTQDIKEHIAAIKPPKDSWKAEMLRMLVQLAEDRIRTVCDIVDGFLILHQYQGYELPEDLNALQVGVTLEATQDEALEVSKQLEKDEQNLVELHSTFSEQFLTWKVPLLRSSQERKQLKRSFLPFRKALVAAGGLRSEHLPAGVRNEDEAAMVVDVLYYLHSLSMAAPTPEQAHQQIKPTLDLRQRIIDQEAIIAELKVQNNIDKTPAVHNFPLGLLGLLQDRPTWEKMRSIVVASWPDNTGEQVAGAVEQLLFHDDKK